MAASAAETIDCSERMVLPGFVNAHTHSVEHWARGLIRPLPLELWVQQLIRHEPRGCCGWFKEESWSATPAEAIGLSAMLCGVEALMSGCTVVLDHLLIRNLEDLEQAVQAYKALGIRAFIAPMLGDDADMYSNYIPTVPDAAERNGKMREDGSCCRGMRGDGSFRTERGQRDVKKTEEVIRLWEDAATRFHAPDEGIEIVIGPVTVYNASSELLAAATEIRKKYNLRGHIHLLETRAQAMMARQWFPSGSAVKHLRDLGFLQLPGTSCAHGIWLDDEEASIMAECGASIVHNPLSNLRLGSGIMPLQKYEHAGVNITLGCDGSCSSDGQDMLEVLKLATILQTVSSPEYRDWPLPSKTALQLASANGYAAVGMKGKAGEIAEGMEADLTLWDLTSLALLPRTDPLSLLVLGSRSQAPGSGSTLSDAWVRGRRVMRDGQPAGVSLQKLRSFLLAAQPHYRHPNVTEPSTSDMTAACEEEYRAALMLSPPVAAWPPSMTEYPQDRVIYDSCMTTPGTS
ncbi:hypothetical protein GUITHDRAFT_107140 [Guillardia theta CCMP2712]|uniref:Amidohydrolase-related domain-containing protein n=1 Tax=Guillardia theta (strain CCMP2712) TaxID=905079 RepID=L1JGG2_GUITC|nr:hypothetical protein GUITHDRAFT_107140 [Guillardia theta CCMP2712]EKX47229.1 hypothetical protein GUITHDRAFT_107140 [Guillardia theta CCMP2712]|eukprot:XP_005834209.1 hypothetical protein GUITHDRAFT_107140 [Guillardia theta CCMP2712]